MHSLSILLCSLVPYVYSASGCTLPTVPNMSPNWEVTCFATGVSDGRSLAISETSTTTIVYISTQGSRVYAAIDDDKDGSADRQFTVIDDLVNPNGITFHNGTLYVAEVSTVYAYEKADSFALQGKKLGNKKIFHSGFPTDTWHGWKYIDIHDNYFYIPIGAPCNICSQQLLANELYASIWRLDMQGKNRTLVAKGVRNTVGFTWHPDTNEMWFTDNGRDSLGDNRPDDELNRVAKNGLSYGYPYCHTLGKGDPYLRLPGSDNIEVITDPQENPSESNHKCTEFVKSASAVGPHVAALGMMFYQGPMTPDFKDGLEEGGRVALVAEHGSWNRERVIGYRISAYQVDKKGEKVTKHWIFADGWSNNITGTTTGRPVDIKPLADGSFIASIGSYAIIRFKAVNVIKEDNCKYTEWSGWGNCCKASANITTEQRMRSLSASNTATGCTALTESRNCSDPSSTGCGNGPPPSPPPSTSCAVGPWGNWSSCDKMCNGQITRSRRSTVGPRSSSDCPLTQQTACNMTCGDDQQPSCPQSQCSKQCKNNGICVIRNCNTECLCPPAYLGEYCEKEATQCKTDVCLNGGKCSLRWNLQVCNCTGTGFQGGNCEVRNNETQGSSSDCNQQGLGGCIFKLQTNTQNLTSCVFNQHLASCAVENKCLETVAIWCSGLFRTNSPDCLPIQCTAPRETSCRAPVYHACYLDVTLQTKRGLVPCEQSAALLDCVHISGCTSFREIACSYWKKQECDKQNGQPIPPSAIPAQCKKYVTGGSTMDSTTLLMLMSGDYNEFMYLYDKTQRDSNASADLTPLYVVASVFAGVALVSVAAAAAIYKKRRGNTMVEDAQYQQMNL